MYSILLYNRLRPKRISYLKPFLTHWLPRAGRQFKSVGIKKISEGTF